MIHRTIPDTIHPPEVVLRDGPIVIICEHASRHIPEVYAGLGATEEARTGHTAWDPGARGLALGLAERLDASMVAATVSRLVYDCNRPPDAPSAMPTSSEVHAIPGNQGLDSAEKSARTSAIYAPFHQAVADVLCARTAPVIVTIHSFTPVYHGRFRPLDLGVLHDTDSRLADAMLAQPSGEKTIERNAPYGAADGVTHTLQRHALAAKIPNVMLELRNDLIASPAQQDDWAAFLASRITTALAQLEARCPQP